MERMKYGYARVSTDDLNPALQLAALKKDGCETIFKDAGLSGATTKRPALLRCLKKLEHGDTLTVWKLALTEAIDTETRRAAPCGR
jgi:DNA invertase Pin-like site-specific DNA recombinase